MPQSPIEVRLTLLEKGLELGYSTITEEKITKIFKYTQEEKREALAAEFLEMMNTMTEQEIAAEADRMLEMIEVLKHGSQ